MSLLSAIDTKQPAFQIAVSVSLVLVVGVIIFAIIYSILTGTPLNSAVSNLIAFVLGGGLTAAGGQLSVNHYQRGANSVSATP